MDYAGRVRHERRASPRNAVRSGLPDPRAGLYADATGSLDASDVRVLLVESDPSTEGMLRDFGYDVCAAHDGRDVVAAALAVRPDVVVCDIDGPQRDAWQLASDFRGDPAFRHTALVALSRSALASDREQALRAGFDAYLVRPVGLERLRAALDEVVRLPGRSPR